MTADEFKFQIERLKTCFNPAAFPAERVKLIWRECGSFEVYEFRQMIDELIADSRYAPTMKEFRAHATKLREKKIRIERDRERQSAQAFFAGQIRFKDEDKKTAMQMIMKRINGEMGDEEWRQCQELLREAAKGGTRPPRCQLCGDEGEIVAWKNQHQYSFKCDCEAGRALGVKIPVITKAAVLRFDYLERFDGEPVAI